VIGTGEGRGVTSVGSAQAIAPMAADIQKGVYLALRVTHYEDRVFAHIRAEEVTELRDLALVAQEQPAAGKNLPLNYSNL
jgi:hypothetical protein